MKKYSSFLIALSFIIFATSYAHAQLGIQAGYAYTMNKGNLTLGQQNHFSGNLTNSGFQAGLTYDFNFAKTNFAIQTGVIYSIYAGNTKEQSKKVGNIYGTLTSNTTYQYLNVPLRVAYSLVVDNNLRIFFFAGPNFTYGLSAKMNEAKIIGEYSIGGNTEQIIKGYDIYDAYKKELSRFDMQIGVGGGVHYKRYRLQVGYDFGILNTYTGQTVRNINGAINKLKRDQLFVSLGYTF